MAASGQGAAQGEAYDAGQGVDPAFHQSQCPEMSRGKEGARALGAALRGPPRGEGYSLLGGEAGRLHPSAGKIQALAGQHAPVEAEDGLDTEGERGYP